MERIIKPEDFKPIADSAMVLDVRRKTDREASNETIRGAFWKDPEHIDQWIGALPKNHAIVIYCVRGGGGSNSVVDRLHADGVNARFIEGGIKAYQAASARSRKNEGSRASASNRLQLLSRRLPTHASG